MSSHVSKHLHGSQHGGLRDDSAAPPRHPTSVARAATDMSLFFNLSIYLCCLLCLSLPQLSQGVRYDCCLPHFSATGMGCEVTTTYENTTYYCVLVAESCTSCSLSANRSSTECYQCCATSEDDCGLPYTYISTSSWTLICIIFAVSCCCCSLIFMSAEHSRMKEGITFREAYLLPIPLVAAITDFDDKEMQMPPDQPTAIARPHTTIDVVVAEPSENSALLGFYGGNDRGFLWEN